jgi:hypothetical protein
LGTLAIQPEHMNILKLNRTGKDKTPNHICNNG